LLISVIIPVYRDAEALSRSLAVIPFGNAETIIVVADDDESCAALRMGHPGIRWMHAPRGRARQMNAGAAVARGGWLLFLHADTALPSGWQAVVERAAADPNVTVGCFRFALDSASWFARLIELGVRVRVLIFRLPYGDQALFIRRDVFAKLGGYSDLPIMEDVDLIRRLRVTGRLFAASEQAVTSARRWEEDGWLRRTVRHLSLIARYFAGIPPERLV
jgi:rSAM/selenodomain-associated transferase 2